MTEPTDAELKAMWQLHAADIGGIFDFARAVLAKWGQPAQAAEPVALLVRKNSWRAGQWEVAPPDSPTYGQAWADQREYVYTAPQPVAREPLTDGQIHAIYDEVARREPYAGAVTRRNLVRAIEAAHGIKGGQHEST